MKIDLPSLLQFLLLSALLTSCSVYAPVQPTVPQLTARGQAEVVALVHLNGQVGGSVAYSPLRYATVLATSYSKSDSRDTTYFRNRQFEVAAGGYHPIGRHFLISALGGYGRAKSARGFRENRHPFPT
ncbi:hypothetical protein [Hymenobacter sp. BT491]|uniref:hypothetical protein n=1 Tax=Hymenobacter sp. BT491 TaxID=2766779 RepID=UPI001653502D|nr:hypothetical protein [Hymenobacter sp. BT491]MBC6988139.1 hypothetical protein [Hymenobacter sp. BT491]